MVSLTLLPRPPEVPEGARRRVEVSPRTGIATVLWTWMENGHPRGYRLQISERLAGDILGAAVPPAKKPEPPSIFAQRDLTEAELLDPALFTTYREQQ